MLGWMKLDCIRKKTQTIISSFLLHKMFEVAGAVVVVSGHRHLSRISYS